MYTLFLVILVKGESDIFFAFPIFRNFIVLFEYTYEVSCMFLSDILDSEIVHHKCEANWSPFVLPKPWC